MHIADRGKLEGHFVFFEGQFEFIFADIKKTACGKIVCRRRFLFLIFLSVQAEALLMRPEPAFSRLTG